MLYNSFFKKTFILIINLLLLLLNTGCSDLRQALGKEKFVPDEYSVMKTPKLVVPPGFGSESDLFKGKEEQEKKIITLKRETSNNDEFMSLFDTSNVPSNIRKLVDQETLGISISARRGIDILMGTNPEVGVVLESEKETKRIKKIKKESESILSGPTDSIDINNNTVIQIK